MSPMVPGLAGGKMSSSDPDSKIDFLDSPADVKRKIKRAFCEEGNVQENGVLSFVEMVLVPISQLRIERMHGETGADADEGANAVGRQTPFALEGAPEGTLFSINRPEKYGGPLHYQVFGDLKRDFEEKKVHPGDLKAAVGDAIVQLLEPIRKMFEESQEWQEVEKLAYPPPPQPEKKKKKVRLDCCVSLAWVGVLSRVIQEKVYHPPPPGKGKDARLDAAVTTDGGDAVPAPTAETHSSAEAAKQQA